MHRLWNIWNANGEVKINDRYTLQGFSVAGFRTNFYIKELSLMFDAGLCSNFNATHIFLTHSHCDHIMNLPSHLMTKLSIQRKIYCPKSAVEHIDAYIRSLFVATNGGKDTWHRRNHTTVGIENYDFFDIVVKNQRLIVEVIKCDHSVYSVGYGFISTKKKLKPSLIGSKNIRNLSDGEKYDFTPCYEFCFIGDTSCDVLNDEALERYQSVIIECSFLYEEHIERSIKTKHMHWQQLKPFVLSHPLQQFFLYHFSARYSPQQIVDFFQTENVVNVVILANEKE